MLLTQGHYKEPMDMWGVGCVFFEIIGFRPLFPGENELDQINKIHGVIGTPSKEHLAKLRKNGCNIASNFPATKGSALARNIPNASPDAVRLITRFLAYDPDDRITAKEALADPYFKELREADEASARVAPAEAHMSPPSVAKQKSNSSKDLSAGRSRMPVIGGAGGALRKSDGDASSSTGLMVLPAIGGTGGASNKVQHKKKYGQVYAGGAGGGAAAVGTKQRAGFGGSKIPVGGNNNSLNYNSSSGGSYKPFQSLPVQ